MIAFFFSVHLTLGTVNKPLVLNAMVFLTFLGIVYLLSFLRVSSQHSTV